MNFFIVKLFDKTSNYLFPFLFSLSFFVFVLLFLLKCLSGAQKLEIDIAIDHPDLLKVYYSHSGQYREEHSSPPLQIDRQRSNKTIPLGNGFANFIRIDTGLQEGRAIIYNIKVIGFFIPTLELSPAEINSMFSSSPDASMQIFPDRIEVVSTGNDPYIYCKKPIYGPQYLKSFALALIFTSLVVTFLFSFRHDSRETQRSGFTDPNAPTHGNSVENTTRTGGIHPHATAMDRFIALDGLRGFAALMVIADHTWGWFRGVGASGVWIFFALSGFLLARPFIGQPNLVLSFSYMSQYLRRRLLRILPMYFVYIFVVFAISGRLNLALMHCLFLTGDGHLWAIPQEVIFYLLWPLVVLVLLLPLRNVPKLSPIALLISLVAWNGFVGIDRIWLLGMNHIKLPLFFGIFLTGAFFSYVYSLSSPYLSTLAHRYRLLVARLASFIGMMTLLFFLLLSTGRIFGEKIIYSQMHFGFYGFLAGTVIVCVLLAKGRALHNFLSIPTLRAIGTVGFSLYLIHPLVKRLVEDFSILFFGEKIIGFPLFLATLVASYFVAKFTYLYIEKPIFQGSNPAPAESTDLGMPPAQSSLPVADPTFASPPKHFSHAEQRTILQEKREGLP